MHASSAPRASGSELRRAAHRRRDPGEQLVAIEIAIDPQPEVTPFPGGEGPAFSRKTEGSDEERVVSELRMHVEGQVRRVNREVVLHR